MSRFFLSVSVLALIAAGCHKDPCCTSQVYNSSLQQHKPVIAIAPVIDNTQTDYAWSLSDELSSALYQRIGQKNSLTLLDAPKVRAQVRKIGEKEFPFSSNISWVKKAFAGNDFVVFLELIEHEEVLHQKQNGKKAIDPSECSGELHMTMRLRVFDVRTDQPKVILQELIHDTHQIPRPFTQANFYQVPWGDMSFNMSPIGAAHTAFTKEIAKRIEEYVFSHL